MARKLKGKIVSDKMTKTRVVAVTRLKLHPKYRKHYKVTQRFKAHDEKTNTKWEKKSLLKNAGRCQKKNDGE